MAKDRIDDRVAIQWLLETDNVGIRYLATRDLIEADTNELNKSRKRAHVEGPIAQVLSKMNSEGYWEKPGSGYYPKYKGTVWSIILLAQLGASIQVDERITTACSYVLDHTLSKGGHFTINGQPSGTVDCLQGNLCASLLDLGPEDSRLDKAFQAV